MSTIRRHLDIVASPTRPPSSAPHASAPSSAPHAAGTGEANVWDESELLQVGELAKTTGKTVRALHLYEDLGLITPVRRSKGRYRLFAPDAKLRIRWISKMQSLGLSLTDIQGLVQQRHASPSAERAARELRQVYADKLAEVTETIQRYRALEQELRDSLAFLDTCSSSCHDDAEWNSCPSCERHGSARDAAPELISGAQFVSEPA